MTDDYKGLTIGQLRRRCMAQEKEIDRLNQCIVIMEAELDSLKRKCRASNRRVLYEDIGGPDAGDGYDEYK